MGHPEAVGRGKEEEHYRTLLEINNAIITKLTQGELLHAICEAVKRVVPFDSVGLVLHEPETDVLRSAALEGPHQTTHFKVGFEVPKGSPAWLVFDQQHPLLRRDLEAERQFPLEHLAFSEGLRSLCALPLIAQGESIGVLFVASLRRNQYSEEEVSFLQRVANQFALAIQNMKSYERIASLNIQVAGGERRWKAVFENSAIGVALEDIDGRFLAANPAYQKMLGYTEEELQKLTFVDVTHEDCRQRNLELADELRAGEREQFQLEKKYRRKDGSTIWVNLNVSLVPATGTIPRFFLVLSEDIADRKRAQEALRKSEERARTLLEVNNAVITSLMQDSLLSSVSKALHHIVPFDAVAVFLHLQERNTFRIIALEGIVHHFHVGQEVGRTNSSVGWVFEHQRYILRRDVESKWEYENERLLLEEGMHSHCVVPLVVRGTSIGTLNFASKKIGQYSEEDAAFLQEVATQLALAVQNMKAYEEIASLNTKITRAAERSRTLLEINNAIITSLSQDALLSSVSKVLRRAIPFDRCAFTLYQPGKDSFRLVSTDSEAQSDYFRTGREFDRKDSVAGWVYRERRAALRHDLEKEQQFLSERHLLAEGIKSYCVVPLVARGKCIGTLNVGSKAKEQYSAEDAEFLQEAATQVALAVENMEVYEEINALKTRIEAENIYLQEEILKEHNFDEIVGSSPALLEVLQRIELAAPTDATVLLYGETGTGKELLARAIHSRSPRSARAMVTVNCGAIPSGLVESELFGHIKGAFTGALQSMVGRFELADGSTLFLDEVGELPADTQVKLLRVLQEREFQPVGSSYTKKVDVRIIAATNSNLEDDVRAGRFRSDLFYRLNVLPLRVPALRERRTDIPELVLFFLERSCQRFGKKIGAVSQETMQHLVDYEWPGNIRELQNVIERGVVLSRGTVLTLGSDLLPMAESTTAAGHSISEAPVPGNRPPSKSQKDEVHRSLEAIEREHIVRVLESTGGVIDGTKGAAQILDLHPSTLRARMKKLQIQRTAR